MTEQLPFPYPMRDLTNEENLNLEIEDEMMLAKVELVGCRTNCSSRIKELGATLFNFKPRPTDIWLVGFPRSGTTLTQEILYLLGTDLNYEKAAAEVMDLRFPVLHTALYRSREDAECFEECPIKDELIKPAHELLDETTGRRFIKSHFGFNLLHPDLLKIGCKVVFVVRNFKDAITSFSRFPTLEKEKHVTFKDVWLWFKHDRVSFGNYFEMLEGAWKNRQNKNLLILFYEEINMDKKAALLKIADFLGKKLTQEELEKLMSHLKIENFRNNKSLNNDHLVDIGIFGKNDIYSFIRKGGCGGWKDVIPKDLVQEIDEYVIENLKAIPEFEIPDFWIDIMELDCCKNKNN